MPKQFPNWLPLAILGLAVFIQFFIRWFWAPRRRVANARSAAARLGLEFSSSTINFIIPIAIVKGQIQGRDVWFWRHGSVGVSTRADRCAIVVRPKEHGVQFRLTPQGAGSRIDQVFGARDIQVGDPAFDRAWFVQTDRPEFFTAALTPEIRTRLMGALQAGCRGTFCGEPGKVYYSERGTFLNAGQVARLEQQLSLLLDLATIVEVSAQR